MKTFVISSLVGLGSFALVNAAPVSWSATPSCTEAPSAPTPIAAPVSPTAPPAPAGSVFSFPLSNGFPNVQNPSSQLTAIELQAHGTEPNGPPPPSLQPDDLLSLKLIAFNEITEVAFFTELLNNITSNVPGYTFTDPNARTTAINAITAIQAQEELHAINANGALAHFGQQPIQACKYAFPVSDFTSAVSLAYTFTDVVLGTLANVQLHLAQNGDAGLVPAIGSVIGQEGEQNGYFRTITGKIPSSLPFLTAGAREFAWSALNQNFVVPGSCPAGEVQGVALPIFGALNVLTSPVPAATTTIDFSFTVTDGKTAPPAGGASLVYINQQNVPVVETLQNVQDNNGVVTFSANFPYDQFEMNGLTLAAVVLGSGPFASAEAVAKATIFGPGLIEIN